LQLKHRHMEPALPLGVGKEVLVVVEEADVAEVLQRGQLRWRRVVRVHLEKVEGWDVASLAEMGVVLVGALRQLP
jgi:hypothetical protein